jgi:predicted AAA+ superfamily ATPase
MEELIEKFNRKLDAAPRGFVRSIMNEIYWDARLIGIRGARGVGKTTLLLQYIRKNLPRNESSLYVSLDNIWFAENKLANLSLILDK